jgi:hypothetical protein
MYADMGGSSLLDSDFAPKAITKGAGGGATGTMGEAGAPAALVSGEFGSENMKSKA